MAIESSARAWIEKDETSAFKAVRTLTLMATTEEDAVFLASLHGCIRRGKPDYQSFMKLAIFGAGFDRA